MDHLGTIQSARYGGAESGAITMARTINKLSARKVETVIEPGRHSDGNGLYLYVDAAGAKRWLFMFRWQGKRREMGLGGIARVSLAQARGRAAEARALLAEGRNPISARSAIDAERRSMPTFAAFADELLPEICKGFRNEKHRDQWASTLKAHAGPLAAVALDAVTTELVLKALGPIWHAKPETASRVRGRIERVLDAARARGLIKPPWENPARWRGHLDNLLPRRQALSRGHHAAIPYQEVPAFMAELAKRQSMAARALELTIYCASRSGEILGATWAEFDLDNAVWAIPATRMKAGRQHRVPLSAPALSLVTALREASTSDFVFPGQKPGRPLSNMAMEMLLRRMKRLDVTVHGFRSSFRDWAGETTAFPREIAEAALAHVVGDQTERAYRRGDALARRRELMEAWAKFITSDAEANDG
jgi:integrase